MIAFAANPSRATALAWSSFDAPRPSRSTFAAPSSSSSSTRRPAAANLVASSWASALLPDRRMPVIHTMKPVVCWTSMNPPADRSAHRINPEAIRARQGREYTVRSRDRQIGAHEPANALYRNYGTLGNSGAAGRRTTTQFPAGGCDIARYDAGAGAVPAGVPQAQPASRTVGREVATPRTRSNRRPEIVPGADTRSRSSSAARADRAAAPGTAGRPAPEERAQA